MAKLSDLQLFKGKISDVKREILTRTSGSTSISTDAFTGKVSGSGSVETQHKYYTEFEINGTQFRFDGDFTFKDGDEVALYAELTGNGFYQAKILKNATRNFFDNEIEKPNNQFLEFIGGFVIGYVLGMVMVLVVGLVADKILNRADVAEMLNSNYALNIAIYGVFCPILGLLGGRSGYKNAKGKRTKLADMVKEIQGYKGEK